MDKSILSIVESIGAATSEPIERRLTYYWLEGRKFIHLHEKEVTKEEIAAILDSVAEDGGSYPFSSDYLVVVVGKTSAPFKDKDLEFMRNGGEHVAFFLIDEAKGQAYYPKGFVFPPRFSYRKIFKALAQKFDKQHD